MRAKFWGTRGSIATPGPGTVHFGGNTSCVEVTTNAGDIFMFDCGTGARSLGASLVASGKPIKATILLSHTHWDHIQGFPFFTPLFMPGNEITVCGPQGSGRSLHDVLAGQMEFNYFPVELNALPAKITFRELAEGTHEFGTTRVVAQYLNHPTMTLGYRIEADDSAAIYFCDHEPFSTTFWHKQPTLGDADSIVHEGDRRHARFMAGAGLVIHDAQYTPEEFPARKNWGHSTYEYAVGLAAAAGVRHLALTHHDPAHDDAFVQGIEQRARAFAREVGPSIEVVCAYEGLELNVVAHGVSPWLQRGTVATQVTSEMARPSNRPRRILVVDDSEDLRDLAKVALMQDGYIVMEAPTGEAGLVIADSWKPDIILLDLIMPGLSGLEVLKMLRSRPATALTPILVLTGMDDEENIREGFELGATDYLTKPFSVPHLAARVRASLIRTEAEQS